MQRTSWLLSEFCFLTGFCQTLAMELFFHFWNTIPSEDEWAVLWRLPWSSCSSCCPCRGGIRLSSSELSKRRFLLSVS